MKSRRKKGSSAAEQWDSLVATASSQLDVNSKKKKKKMAAAMPPPLPGGGAPGPGPSTRPVPFVRQEPSQADIGIAETLASMSASIANSASASAQPPVFYPPPPTAHSQQTNGTSATNAAARQHHPQNHLLQPQRHQAQGPPQSGGPSHPLYNTLPPFFQPDSMKQEDRPNPGSMAMGNIASSFLATSRPSSFSAQQPQPLPNGHSNHTPPPFRGCTCENDVPEILLQILDWTADPLLEHLRQFMPCRPKLCYTHVHKFDGKVLNFLLQKEAHRATAESMASSASAFTIPSAVVANGVPSPPADHDDELMPAQHQQRADGERCGSSYYECVVAGGPCTRAHNHQPVAQQHGAQLHGAQQHPQRLQHLRYQPIPEQQSGDPRLGAARYTPIPEQQSGGSELDARQQHRIPKQQSGALGPDTPRYPEVATHHLDASGPDARQYPHIDPQHPHRSGLCPSARYEATGYGAPGYNATRHNAPPHGGRRLDAMTYASPKIDAPRPDVARYNGPRFDPSRLGTPRQDATNPDAPGPDAMKYDGPRQASLRLGTPRQDHARLEPPGQDAARLDTPRQVAARLSASGPDDPRYDGIPNGAPRLNTPRQEAARLDIPRQDAARFAAGPDAPRHNGPRSEAPPPLDTSRHSAAIPNHTQQDAARHGTLQQVVRRLGTPAPDAPEVDAQRLGVPSLGMPRHGPPPFSPPTFADPWYNTPKLNTAHDQAFRQQVMRELQARPSLAKGKAHGDVTARLILRLLQAVESPTADEALVLSGQDAAARVDVGVTDCPVFTEGQQQFTWAPGSRPITEMFQRMENLNRNVSVQIPSRKSHTRSFEKHKLFEVQQRFLESNDDTDDPWNILDLRNPLPPTVMPRFLAGENCQLLSRVRDAVLSGGSGERTVAAKEKWNEWLDVMDWVLLSEGGHHTAPHMDSHGLATWITIQEGQFGFGWLSKPTKEERDAWIANPHEFNGGRWRFTVLTPGRTVFFNSGTIHFVFRLHRGQTLALGGHILQWSGIERWITVLRDQLRSPHITNEDVEWSAPKYVRVVSDLVMNRVKSGRVAELGGQEVVDRFLALIQELEKDKPDIKQARPPSKKRKR